LEGGRVAGKGYVLKSSRAAEYNRDTTIKEKPVKKPKLPKTGSIQELAEFWDTHDLTDFEKVLEEVAEPPIASVTAIKVPLESRQIEAIEQLARSKGVSREELVRGWVLQKLTRRSNARPADQ
jgi:hypothetical protein